MSKNILVIAAHPDDEVLGCGGTIARHSDDGDHVNVLFIADGVGARSADFEYNLTQRKKAACKAGKILGVKSMNFLDFPDNRLDTIALLSIVQKIEPMIQKFKPEIIYTHHNSDLNVDHQITHRATMTACRPLPNTYIKQIYAFEVLSSTEWNLQGTHFQPNVFIDIDTYFSKKQEAIQVYDHEMRPFPHSRSMKHVEVLAIHRGATVGLNKAEAFSLIRMIRDQQL